MKQIADWLSEHEAILRAIYRAGVLVALAAMAVEMSALRRESPSSYTVEQIKEYVARIDRDVAALREKLAPRY